MQRNLLFLFTFLFLLTGIQPAAAVLRPIDTPTATEAAAPTAINKAKEDWKEMSRKEKRQLRKQVRQEIKAQRASTDVSFTVLIILAILLPWLAMLLYDGASNRFLISLLLWFLFVIPSIVYTLIVILGEN